jgi:hypothetical protein
VLGRCQDITLMFPSHVIDADQVLPFVKLIARADEVIE